MGSGMLIPPDTPLVLLHGRPAVGRDISGDAAANDLDHLITDVADDGRAENGADGDARSQQEGQGSGSKSPDEGCGCSASRHRVPHDLSGRILGFLLLIFCMLRFPRGRIDR